MVVRKPVQMFTRLPAVLIFLCFLLRCSGPAASFPLADLDYAEVADQTGWKLRLYGDGSGSLSHDQLPAYHLHYPPATFDARPARQLTGRCKGKNESPVCVVVSFYAAADDRTTECPCAPGEWPARIMEEAIGQMPQAVEAGGSERSCRMLLRRWLATR